MVRAAWRRIWGWPGLATCHREANLLAVVADPGHTKESLVTRNAPKFDVPLAGR
jgi:hypothetical protein